MKQILKVLHQISLTIFITFLAISCASTTKSRIKEKEKEFFGYPPDVQGQIQAGQIDKGFNEDMVYLAKGTPTDKATHQKAGKTITIWKYYQKADVAAPPGSSAPGFAGAYEYPSPGKPQQPYPMFYNKPGLVVEFENGKVKSWIDNK